MLAPATHILQTLTDAGYEAYFAGGCVRDVLLKRAPHDFDVATSATPEQVAQLFGAAKFVGANFGVSLVRVDNVDIEVATFRTDGAYIDNRRPDSVRFTTNAAEDVQRRDFTINALLMDSKGYVVDHVGGKADVADRILRTVGNPNDRFREDALRMLRLVRFACVLGFTVEPNTMAACQANAASIATLPAERVSVELVKMLTSGRAKLAMELLVETGLIQYVLPEINI